MKYLIAVLLVAVTCLAGWFLLQNQDVQQTSYYGRVLFGEDPSHSDAWRHFIVRGTEVFIDQNKDDICDANELLDSSKPINLKADGKDFSIVSAQAGINPDVVSDTLPQRLQLVVNVLEKRPYQMAGKMLLTEASDHCNWLQFGGDLRFIVMDDPMLKAGSKKAEMKIFIGTSTSGPPSSTVQVANESDSNASDVFRTAIVMPVHQSPYPTLELAFVHDESVAASQQLPLDHFC